MTGGEHGTAIFERLDGNIERFDFAGNAHDLLFIHADDRTEYRQIGDRIGTGECGDGLTGDLSDAFPRDQGWISS